MTSINKETATPAWSTKMSFLFGLCALLGVLLLIFSEIGLAQPTGGRGGFRPGGAAIGSPMNDPYAEDDEFDEFDDEAGGPNIPKSVNRGNPNAGLPAAPMGGNSGGAPGAGSGISMGGGSSFDDKPVAEVKRGRNGYQLTGPGSEKGIKSKKEADTLSVDTESGDGIPASTETITDFNFPNANVLDLAKTMGRLTGKSFILDKDVKGDVSIISNAPITVSDAWRAFLTALDMNQLAIVPTGKFLRIMRQNDAKGKNVRLYSNSQAPNTDALVTKIFKIKYINSKELENVIRTYANMGARIYGHEQTNTLIITDTGSNIDKMAKMIAFLDVEGFDAGIEVVQVKYASAVELQKLIDTLLPGTQAAVPGARPGFPGGGFAGGGGSRSTFSPRRTKEGGLVNNIIADDRTNTLIVHANTKGATQVRELVARLDRKLPAAAMGGGKVHVVYLQFADSEEMSKTLNNFSSNAAGKPGAPGGFNPGGSVGGVGVNPNENALFEGQIKVSSDKPTNSLVITASPNDYGTLLRVINKLDIPRDQIYVEVVILEVDVQRTSQFAANVLLPGGTSVAPTNDLAKLLANPTNPPPGLVLKWQNGSAGTINLPSGAGAATNSVTIPNLAFLLKAFQQYSGANILATPQLMTMDNEEATFDSTDKVPIPQVNNAGLGIQTTTYSYLSVPLSIKIKPQLNKVSNFIKMHITANISDFTNKSTTEQAQATLERKAETSVMVHDTDTVVLGGLIRDKTSEVVAKVPLLGDIPILGWLFKSKSTQIDKSNLLLFITPKILRQPEAVRAVLDKKLKERDEFVEKEMGGEDDHREARNQIIRSLPDPKTIKNYTNNKRIMNLDDDEQVKENSKEAAMNNNGAGTETKDSLTLPAAEPVPSNPPPAQAPAQPSAIIPERIEVKPAKPTEPAPAPPAKDVPPPPMTAPSSDPFAVPGATQ